MSNELPQSWVDCDVDQAAELLAKCAYDAHQKRAGSPSRQLLSPTAQSSMPSRQAIAPPNHTEMGTMQRALTSLKNAPSALQRSSGQTAASLQALAAKHPLLAAGLTSGLGGAAIGGLLGGLSSFTQDKERRQPLRSALRGALAGGALGGGAYTLAAQYEPIKRKLNQWLTQTAPDEGSVRKRVQETLFGGATTPEGRTLPEDVYRNDQALLEKYHLNNSQYGQLMAALKGMDPREWPKALQIAGGADALSHAAGGVGSAFGSTKATGAVTSEALEKYLASPKAEKLLTKPQVESLKRLVNREEGGSIQNLFQIWKDQAKKARRSGGRPGALAQLPNRVLNRQGLGLALRPRGPLGYLPRATSLKGALGRTLPYLALPAALGLLRRNENMSPEELARVQELISRRGTN